MASSRPCPKFGVSQWPAQRALTGPRRPNLPVDRADLVRLAVAAEFFDDFLPRPPPHGLEAFGIAHQRFERGRARVATTASPAAIASSIVSPKPSTREAKT